MRYDNNLLKQDLSAWFVVVVIFNICNSTMKEKDPFDIEWFYYSLASLFGISVHSLITKNITIFIIKKFKIENIRIIKALNDTITLSTVYILNNIIFTHFIHKDKMFSEKWLKLSSGIILGYIFFDLFIEKEILNINMDEKNYELISDLIKSGIGLLLGFFISDGHININGAHNILSVEIALIVYYLIVKKFIPSILL